MKKPNLPKIFDNYHYFHFQKSLKIIFLNCKRIEIVFCLNYFTANDQEKQVKCNLIFPQGAKVEKRTASKSFLKARPKAEPSECLRAGLFSTEAPWGKIKLHETGFSVSFQLKNNSNRMFFRIYWTFLKILM